MKIEDLIQLLNNRLREFKLSRDYAKMSGDLERMNTADKEVIALEDTLYQLNLLVDTSKSVAVKESTLTEVITDGSVSVLGEYDISPYATDSEHEEKIMNILSKMGVMDTVGKIDDYIKGKYESSPVAGGMITSASEAYAVDVRLMMAIMELDSRFGTVGIATSTLNPGNVGNDDDGNTRTYESWQGGVTAVAEWLSRHRITKGTTAGITPSETTATSTLKIIFPTESQQEKTATSTPEITPIATSTPSTATSTPETATSTEEIISNTATSTPEITPIATSTPSTATSTPETATSTEEIISNTATSTPEITPIATSTQSITTSIIEEIISNTATSTPEITPIATSTPSTATSTPETEITPFETTATTTDTATLTTSN